MKRPVNPQVADTSKWAGPEKYNQFIRGLELRSIRMTSGEFSAPPFQVEDAPIDAVVSIVGARYEEADGGFVAFHKLSFAGTCHSGGDASVSVEGEYAVAFGSEVSISESLFLPFAQLNLPVNTWPYFREFVQSSLSYLEWPSTTLPALRSIGGTVDVSDGELELAESDEPEAEP